MAEAHFDEPARVLAGGARTESGSAFWTLIPPSTGTVAPRRAA